MQQCSAGDDLVLMAASLAISLARNLDADGTNSLSFFFTALGSNLAIIAAEKQTLENIDACKNKTGLGNSGQ